jgi:hypothetical protein
MTQKRESKGTSDGGKFAKDTSGKNAMPDSEPLPATSVEPTKEDIHELTNVWAAYKTKVPSTITDPNVIAAWIREIDGNHEMGAGELGEEIADRIEKELHRQATIGNLTPINPIPLP